MLENTSGIFLHSVKYGENSQIASIYTESYGRKSFMINSSRGKNSSVKASFFQPLYLLDLEVYFKPGREIYRIKSARISNPYSTIPFDIRKSSQVIFLGEILYKCLREEEPNQGLYSFITNSLTFLDLTDSGISNFHVWFLFRLTQFLGIFPNQDNLLTSNFFDLQSARFVSHEPVHHQFTDKQVTVLFSRLFDVGLSSIDSLNYSHKERMLVLEILLAFYKIHFDNFGEIRSLGVLKEVLK